MTAAPQPANRSIVLGLLGSGVSQSRSPFIHETEAAHMRLQLTYRAVDFARHELGAADLKDAFRWLEAFGYDGVNVTHPFKQAVIPHLQSLSQSAADIGAVNTIVLRDGKRTGHNTDWMGYQRNFGRALPEADLSHVVQIGAGGAAAAVAYALLSAGAQRLAIRDTQNERACGLSQRLSQLFPDRTIVATDDVAQEMRYATGIVQTSPVGMTGHPGTPIELEWLRPRMWVSEIIYFPLETELLAKARSIGCPTVDGTGMLVFQASEAFRLFTGMKPDDERMLRDFHTNLRDEA